MPQEIALDIFSTRLEDRPLQPRPVRPPRRRPYVEQLLRDLSLWEKRESRVVELSGGMKRRVMIAKALSHEPEVLFLDEPTAGVDVNLRRDMWALVRRLRDKGVTVILTTHYIEEAEEMADRVGVINGGRIVLVEDKTALMHKLGKRRLTLTLREPMSALPAVAGGLAARARGGRQRLVYTFDANAEGGGIPALLRRLGEMGVDFRDLETRPARSRIFSSAWSGAPRERSMPINTHGIWAIYRHEMARTGRTIWQSVAMPVITTALYFVVFGGAIGSRINRSAALATAPSSCPD